MRVTNSMLSRTVLQNLNRNLEAMNRSQNRMSSGKQVSRPSDDPVVVARSMALNTVIQEQEQFERNMQDAIGWLDTADGALGSVTTVLQRARELGVYGANDTMSDADRRALAAEVDQLIGEMVQVANTNYGGRYLFAGSKTTAAPFAGGADMVTYQGDDREMEWEMSPGVTMAVNLPGSTAFRVATEDGQEVAGVFKDLFSLRDVLNSGGDVASVVSEIEASLEHVVDQRASLGARSNRLRLALERSSQYKVDVQAVLSRLGDIDLAEEVMNYKIQENVFQAALATAAKVLQPSLLDYL